VKCNQCSAQFECSGARANRASKIGAPLYCGRACAGLGRRLKNTPTEKERKAAKAVYDREYRALNHELLRQKKAIWHRDHYDRERAAVERKKRMPQHVEYCRHPEYKAYKHEYDARRKEAEYAEWAETWRLLLDLEKEIRSQASAYERRVANGYYLRNAQKRRRELCQSRKNSTPAI
jgi:hypothetical protein